MVAAALGVVATAVSCGGHDARDSAAFCASLRANRPGLTDASDPVALIKLYQRLDQHAPLQIKDDWHTITGLLQTVATYRPTDTSQTQPVRQAVLSSQAAVDAIGTWAAHTCQVDLGPVPTTVAIGGTGTHLLSESGINTIPTTTLPPIPTANPNATAN